MAGSEKRNWTREEHILAFNLYCQIPFGTMHMGNPKVQQLAKVIGRSPGAVAYKLTNFARLDPALQARGIKGSQHGAKGEEQVWDEFAHDPESLAFESQLLMAQLAGQSIEQYAAIQNGDLPTEGKEREALVRQRVNQDFFRRRVLSAYNFRCCITGIAIQPLLVASHIVPWAEDPKNRLNPRNGLCLNALHDRAFDRGLIWIDDDLRVRYNRDLQKESDWDDAKPLVALDGHPLKLYRGFSPDVELLKRHREKFVA